MRLRLSKRAGQRGHAMLELALSAGILVAALGGTFEFGYSFYVYNQLVGAVGNAGRYAAQRTYRAATPADVEKGNAAIRNLVVYGHPRPAGDARPLAPGLTPQNVSVSWVLNGSGAPEAVDIAIAEYSIQAIFGIITLHGKPAVEFPFAGKYAPHESEP